MWLVGLYCLVLLTLLPYIAGFAVVERLRGWLRIVAIGGLLALCVFIPFWFVEPSIQRANRNSPDFSGYVMLEVLLTVAPLLIETAAGMISAGVQQARRRRVTVR